MKMKELIANSIQNYRQTSKDFPEAYVWKQADIFAREFLPENGYKISSFEIEDDCIGYRCDYKGSAHTIFVYSYGEKQTSRLDGDYCAKLTDFPFSKDSKVLVLYIHVAKKVDTDGKITFEVMNYSKTSKKFQFWQVEKVDNRNLLDYYPRKEIKDMVLRFIAAYNNQSLDALETITTQNPAIHILEWEGTFFNSSFYSNLSRLFKEYWKMTLAYVRYNDVVYSSVPYLKGYGFFDMTVTPTDNKISHIGAHALDNKYKELFIVDIPADYTIDKAPLIKTIHFLPPETTQRFAVKIEFENGEIKKYSLPLNSLREYPYSTEDKEYENAEVVRFKHYIFTDKIFSNGWLSEHIPKPEDHEFSYYPKRGQGISFINGFVISAVELYNDSVAFVEPIICNEEVFKNNQITITKQAEWKGCRLHIDEETKLIKVALPGCEAFNTKCIATYALQNGQRAIDMDFNYLGSFHEGIVCVAAKSKGYGYIDKNISFIIPPKYYRANEFCNGFAIVSAWDEKNKKETWSFVNKQGKEHHFENEYVEICDNAEGLFRVSVFDLGRDMGGFWKSFKLAYHSDHSDNAGLWGYADSTGKEIIKPKYIFAYDFEKNGLALVCKGKWEWTDEGGATIFGEKQYGGYWSDEQLWGMIDKTGKEVIPCKFDELEILDYGENTKYIKAHYGGWKEGKWGIIDFQGNWVVEPIFEALGYEVSQDECISFYTEDSFADVPQGLYSIKEKKILLEPKFLDIDFEDDGTLKVEIYDENLKRNITQIIDRTGKPLFKSHYTFLYSRKDYYETSIRLDNGDLVHGLIDKKGNEVLPCKYLTKSSGILIDEKRIIFKKDRKCGIMTFDEEIIVEPIYDDLWVRGSFVYAIFGESNNRKFGLLAKNGEIIFPVEYNNISVEDDVIIATNDRSSSLYRIL